MTKVQEVQSFAASDGKLFKNKSSADLYQRELNYVKRMISVIGVPPNSNGYIQLTKKNKRIV